MAQVLLALVLMLSAWPRASAVAGGPVPVVVELFTSEGCSSCPPADALLSRLAREQSLSGVTLIPLGLHVTYWDRLGWKDPSSLQDATDRQQHYGTLWGTDRIYTPQAVVDGQDELVASDEAGLRRAIARAGARPHATVTFTAGIDGDQIVTSIAVTNVPPDVKEPIDIALFVTEDGVTTTVTRGENRGRTLHHDAVVRLARSPWESDVTRPSSRPAATLAIRGLRRDWARERLRAVVVAYGRRTARIVGAATSPLTVTTAPR